MNNYIIKIYNNKITKKATIITELSEDDLKEVLNYNVSIISSKK